MQDADFYHFKREGCIGRIKDSEFFSTEVLNVTDYSSRISHSAKYEPIGSSIELTRQKGAKASKASQMKQNKIIIIIINRSRPEPEE